MSKPEYEFVRTDTGNFRIYFRRTSTKSLYCIQNDGSHGTDRFAFYMCSRDGEPSHQVRWPFFLAFTDVRDIRFRESQS